MKKISAIVLIVVLAFVGLMHYREPALVESQNKISQEINHWEHISQYATLRISAPGDSSIVMAGVDSIPLWIKDFTSQYRNNGKWDSLIYNASKGDTILLDSLAYRLFSFALYFREYSKGDIDVGIGNLLRAWKIGADQPTQLPSKSQLDAFVKDLQTPFYVMDSLKRAMVILKPKHHIALGAFMEGAILQHMASVLERNGAQSYLLEISGDFLYKGVKPNGDPWTLGVKDPANPSELLAVVRTLPQMRSFCTSGDYEQKFVDKNGKQHHHIFNPRTGESSAGKHSATVSTSIPGMNENSLCTWFMILPLEQIKEKVRESKGKIETILVLDSGKVWISDGFRRSTQLVAPGYEILSP